jgi:hypothetical protein
MHIQVLSGVHIQNFQYIRATLIYTYLTGENHWGQYQDQAEMKVSKLIKYQYQAGMEVLNTIHNRYLKREILVQHPQY